MKTRRFPALLTENEPLENQFSRKQTLVRKELLRLSLISDEYKFLQLVKRNGYKTDLGIRFPREPCFKIFLSTTPRKASSQIRFPPTGELGIALYNPAAPLIVEATRLLIDGPESLMRTKDRQGD